MQRARKQAKARWIIDRRQISFPVEPDPDVDGDEGMPGQWITVAVPVPGGTEWWARLPREAARPPRPVSWIRPPGPDLAADEIDEIDDPFIRARLRLRRGTLETDLAPDELAAILAHRNRASARGEPPVPRPPIDSTTPQSPSRPQLETGTRIECTGAVGNPDSVAVVMPLRDGWALRLEFAVDADGKVDVINQQLHRVDPAGPVLGSRMMRSLGLAEELKRAERALGDFMVREHFLGSRWAQPVRKPGRAGRGAIEYVEIAARYVAACKAGGDPYERLLAEEAAAGRFTTRSSLENRIYRARKKHELIEGTEKGRAGGDLTEKGRKLLAELNATKEATSGHD